MRRSTFLGAATAAALAAGSLAVTMAPGSSHREAPKILADPTADNTDVYAFTAPDAPGSLTVVADWIPLEEPAGGPYFGKLDPEARYYVKIDNTGDGRPDVAYRWEFDQRFRNPNSFLDAAPTVDSIDDPDLNFVQTYDLYRETYRGRKVHARRIAHDVPVAPANIGPKTIPDYGKVAAGAIRGIAGGGKTFVGPVDDPFFVDLGTVFDGINIDKPGRPTSASATRAAARTTSRATTPTRSCCRCRRRRSRATARPSPGRAPRTPSSASGPARSAAGSPSAATARRRRSGCRSAGSATR